MKEQGTNPELMYLLRERNGGIANLGDSSACSFRERKPVKTKTK